MNNSLLQYDVAVVGSGPAGATAARELARHGMSVVLLEKEQLPRHKVCGGGIVGRARSMLDFDISAIVRSECHTATMSLAKGGVSCEARRDRPIVSMVVRSEFDHLLVEKACDAGAQLLTECCVETALFQGDSVQLQTTGGQIRARFVIAADGATSTMARLTGWKQPGHLAPAIECELVVPTSEYARFDGCARFDFDMPANGYGWVFPKGEHLNIGVGWFSPRAGKADLKRVLREYLHWLKLPLPERGQVNGYVIPMLPRQDGLVRRRVFLVGDAAGLADPVSAEGISSAIFSGRLAARALVQAELDEPESRAIYEAELARTLLPELAAGRKLAKLLYSSQTLRRWLLRHYGQRLADKVADVFMGDACYRDHAEAFLHRMRLK